MSQSDRNCVVGHGMGCGRRKRRPAQVFVKIGTADAYVGGRDLDIVSLDYSTYRHKRKKGDIP
jgi:hypothetical protein